MVEPTGSLQNTSWSNKKHISTISTIRLLSPIKLILFQTATRWARNKWKMTKEVACSQGNNEKIIRKNKKVFS